MRLYLERITRILHTRKDARYKREREQLCPVFSEQTDREEEKFWFTYRWTALSSIQIKHLTRAIRTQLHRRCRLRNSMALVDRCVCLRRRDSAVVSSFCDRWRIVCVDFVSAFPISSPVYSIRREKCGVALDTFTIFVASWRTTWGFCT